MKIIKIVFCCTGLILLFSCAGVSHHEKINSQSFQEEITEISYEQLLSKMKSGKVVLLIDVREPYEVEEGYINQPDDEGDRLFPKTVTINIPLGELEAKIADEHFWKDDLNLPLPSHKTTLVVYCMAGIRSAQAVRLLQELGYTSVSSYKGGYREWQEKAATGK
ncbi:MAG TPA: rhodanese-like domain-containing protein [Candidatus Cloacimonadota bacterium]|nr:rhodanese-like domain-containing protein [Candidatus Cloacimonadota bacterium]